MLYRENGQFKTSYRADQQIFPILQDRVVIGLFLIFAFAAVPMLASEVLRHGQKGFDRRLSVRH